MIRAALRTGRLRVPRMVVTVLLLSLLLPAVAWGQSEDDGAGVGAGSARLTVTGLTGVLGPGSVAAAPSNDPLAVQPTPDELEIRALVENDGGVALDALRLVVELYPPAESRGHLRQALAGNLGRRQPLHVHDPGVRDGGPLDPGEISGVVASFAREEVVWADGVGGVHPVRIAVLRGTEVLDEVTTAVVWLNNVPRHPLLTTMTWPFQEPPWRGGDGTYPGDVDRPLRPGARLDVLLRVLEQSPSAPVVLVPAAHLLEDLADRSDGFLMRERSARGDVDRRVVGATDDRAQLARRTLSRVRELAARLPFDPVAGAYAHADLPALVNGGPRLRALAAQAAADGRRRTQLQLGREVDSSAFRVEGPLSPAAVDLIPGEALLLPYTTTTEPGLGDDPPLDEPVRPLDTPSGRILTALVADPYLQDALDALGGPSPVGPVVRAHRVLAESAMAYLEDPGRSGRALLLLPPTEWSPSPQSARHLLEGLTSATWMRLTTPRELIASGRREPSSVELAVPAAGPFEPAFVAELGNAVEGLDAVEDALPEGQSRVAGRPVSELRETLLRSGSRWYRGPLAGEASALVREVQQAVDTRFGEVAIAGGGVTLTSDRGTIPVTLQRTRGGPIRVAVEVESQGRLLWPEGRRSEPLVLTSEASQTVSFSTRALSTGTFPVTVRVVDPSGARELARTGVSVRSNAVSEPALAVIAVVVALLLGSAALRRRGRGTKHLQVVG